MRIAQNHGIGSEEHSNVFALSLNLYVQPKPVDHFGYKI